MRKNGFTLIELLAVIVILAIIALIATPIILGIINDAREKANERSVELYASAVRNAVAAYQLTNPNSPTSFEDLDIQYDGEVICLTQELYEDGSFYLEGCKVDDIEKEYSYGTKKGSSKACILDDKDGDGVASLSDVVTCGSENFYVMYNENNEITMLSMYNLYVGNVYDNTTYKTNPLENSTNKQNEIAKGVVYDDNEIPLEENYYGTVAFSTNHYWLDDEMNLLPKYGTKYPTFIFDENSNLYQYVNEYERILKEEIKINSASATIISYKQVTDLQTNKGNPSWLYLTSYWVGSVTDTFGLYMVRSFGFLSYEQGIIDNNRSFGVRPVITISTSEL